MLMKRKPFLLAPAGKDYLWGGNRLKTDFAKDLPLSPLAETWECSTHPDGPSLVASGAYAGQSLGDVLRQNPDFLGTHPEKDGGLPILVKLIDAKQDLSIQVHPTDDYAFAREQGQRGKTEMWYVLDAARDASLIYGLRRDLDAETVRRAAGDGTLPRYLQRVPVRPDDVFFVEAGTIHALGAGALVAEIQESSNLTYRLYDYDRVDQNGQKRPLHLEKALEVADLCAAPEPRQPMRVLRYSPGAARELLCRCRYFEVYRLMVNTDRRQMVTYRADECSFRVLLCVRGCGTVRFAGESLDICRGDCLFVPADSEELRIHGQISFLDIRG